MLQFNSHATNQDLVSEINTIADCDNTSYPVVDKTRRVNSALEEIFAFLRTNIRSWPIGDSNFSSLPTGLVTLVNSQEAYQLMGNMVSAGTGVNTTNPLVNLLGASVKNSSGIWQTLQPITLSDIFRQGIDPAEYFKTDGLPLYYEKREDFLVLYPAPDNGVSVTLTNGLKLFYQRTASLFVSTDTTKVPGIDPAYHILLAYKAALPYCLSYKKDRVPGILREITRLETAMLADYAKKGVETRKGLTMRQTRYR